MNVIKLRQYKNNGPNVTKNLFGHMEKSIKKADISFDKAVLIAKTVAPLLNDLSSNDRHIKLIESNAPIKEKVIAILMLGFPKNQNILAFLQKLLFHDNTSIKIAASIALPQLQDGNNNGLLCDILKEAYKSSSCPKVKKAIKHSLVKVVDKKTATILKEVFI